MLSRAQTMAPTIEEEKTESAELGIYFVVWISHSILAFLLATKASWNVGHWLDHWLEPSSYSSALSMDNSDVELKLFRRSLPNALGAFVINSG
uniref:Transmembrane protein n=1 Tax=Globodera pallida TaxID=36090 RepID=A0A183CP55_GLOPA